MDFEKKYSELRRNRADMPEGYPEELQQKVNRKKEYKKRTLRPYIAGSAVAAMLVTGLFILFRPASDENEQLASADGISSEMADAYVRTLMDNDNLLAQSNVSAPVNAGRIDTPGKELPGTDPLKIAPLNTPADVFADSSFSDDDFFEYLLEEGFEEI